MQNTQQPQCFIDIYKPTETIRVPVDHVLNQTLKQVQKYITSLVGFSSSLFLYQFPVTSFNRLNFVNPDTILKDVLQSFGQVCFTFDNRQYDQQYISSDNLTNSVNNLSLVIQTSQNNYFSHQRYKIDSKGKINFVKSLANRNGRNIHILYYGLRIPLEELDNNQPISSTLYHFVYENNTIILTSDQFENGRQYRTVNNTNLVDFEYFYLIYVEDVDQPLVMDRRAKWQAVLLILSLIFKVNFVRKDQNIKKQQHFKVSNCCKEVYLTKKTQKIEMNPTLQNSFFLGQTLRYLVFLQQSCKLHLYSNQSPFQHINSVILNSSSSIYLQQDIPVLLGEKLTMYNITIKTITLKYYTLPLAELSYVQNYKWDQEYGAVDVDTLDIISVHLKNRNLIRIFYIYSPNDYLQVKYYGEQRVFTSKFGKNITSDGSGLISIYIRGTLFVYNLNDKVKLYKINSSSLDSLQSVYFFEGKTLLTYLGHFQEYSKNGVLVAQGKKDVQEEVYCYTQNGRIFKMTGNVFQLEGARQKIKNGLLKLEQSFISFNSMQAAKFQNIYLSKKQQQ